MSIKKLSLLILSLFMLGCSTKKNTYVNRKYHNLTAYFNVYFNGKDAQKLSMKSLEKMEPESFDEILPVFSFDYPAAAGAVSGEMQRVITKGEKTIQKHSITAKPKKKKSSSREEKDFYNRNEFNNWVDNAHLLMAKAMVNIKEYDQAQEKLNYIITTYPKEYETISEARLFLAILAIKAKEFNDAENTLRSLSRSKFFPETLLSALHASYAELYIKQEKYAEAITSLEKSLDKVRGKHTKIRYNYILAQLNQKLGNNTKSVEYYQKVLKKNPPYHTAFSAEMAITTLSAGKNDEDIRKMLNKALKNERNAEYKDQIYYAFAKLEEKAGNTEKAVEYYYKSIDAGGTNNKQKGQSYLALAEYYITKPEYIKAYTCYDNSARMLGIEHSLYNKAYTEANKLRKLAVNLKVLALEDNLQEIAKLPEGERDKLIKDKVKEINKSEEVRKEKEAVDTEAQKTTQGGLAPGGAGQWYFYNQTALNMGKVDFSSRWGDRKLEDNWRRRDKNITYEFDYDQDEDSDPSILFTENPVVDNVVTEEALLADIPLGDEAMEDSNKKIMNAMFNIGEAFRDDLKNTNKAIEGFENLEQRFSTYSLQSQSYVALYNLYSSIGNTGKANQYKTLMQTRYPKEPQVQALLDPSYVGRKHQEEREHELVYSSALNLYTKGQRLEANSAARNAINKYPTSRLMSQFHLLAIMSDNYNGSIAKYSGALNKLIEDYPKSDAAESAKNILANLSANELELLALDKTEGIEEVVKTSGDYADEDGAHFFVIVLDSKEDITKLQFNLSLFNADNYLNQNYELQVAELGENKQMLIIGELKNKKIALEYYKKISAKKDIFVPIKKDFSSFVISDPNMFKLGNSKDIIGYVSFFRAVYLK